MIAVVVNTVSCWLIKFAPNTDKSVRLGVSLPVDARRRLTGASSRRPGDVLLNFSLEWTAQIQSVDFHKLRNATLAAQDEPFLVPLWQHAIRVGLDTATFTSGLTVAWTRDWAAYAINPGSLAGYDFAAPLLYGRMVPPRLAGQSGELVTADFSFDEDAPAAYALAPVVPADVVIVDSATQNGSFETAGAGGADVFANWTEGPALTYTQDADAHSGSYCCKVANPFPVGVAEHLVKPAILTIGRAYRASFWAKRNGTSGVLIQGMDSAGFYLTGRTPTTVWQQFTQDFVATGTGFWFENNLPAGAELFVDDVVISDITDRPLWADAMVFNTAGGFAAPVFPFVPDAGSPPMPGTAVTDVERTAASQGRQKSSTFYPQTPEQTLQATFKFTTPAGAAGLIEWYRRRAGGAEPEWVALSQTLGRLSGNVAVGAAVMNFSTLAPLGTTIYVALYDPAGRLEVGRISASAALQITLAAGVAKAWSATWTNVSPAMLARMTMRELVLDYTPAGTAWMAVSRVSWREVAPEYAAPAGETRGTTLGRLPGAAWFFQIDLDYNGAIASTYLTNWQSGATIGGHTWAYNPCDFDRRVDSIDLQEDNFNFTMRWFAGCPFENWLPGQLSARGFITVNRADVDASGNLSNFRTKWKGELGPPVFDGPTVKSMVYGANVLFSRKVPRQMMSRTCGTSLFSSRCGLVLADWTWNAVIAAAAANVITIGTLARAIGGGNPAGFGAVDWFALGWLGWPIGGMPMRAGILTSAVLGGGQIVLTLDRTPGLALGTAVTAVPGCDRLGDTCRTKFANYDNFRGFEFMPSVSPSLKIPQKNAAAAKK